MQVVLRSDVDKLGLRGEVVTVARGYARNFLLPRGLAEIATPGLIAEVAKRDARRARQEAKTVEEAQAIADRISNTSLQFDVNAGPTGSLFGSVTPTNVADRLWEELKIRVDRRKLGFDSIKRIGRYTVSVEVFHGVTADLKVVVAPEGGVMPSDEELAAMAGVEAAVEPTVEEAVAEAVAEEETEAEADYHAVEDWNGEGGADTEEDAE
jgi:large subunit ribosomal protein L9